MINGMKIDTEDEKNKIMQASAEAIGCLDDLICSYKKIIIQIQLRSLLFLAQEYLENKISQLENLITDFIRLRECYQTIVEVIKHHGDPAEFFNGSPTDSLQFLSKEIIIINSNVQGLVISCSNFDKDDVLNAKFFTYASISRKTINNIDEYLDSVRLLRSVLSNAEGPPEESHRLSFDPFPAEHSMEKIENDESKKIAYRIKKSDESDVSVTKVEFSAIAPRKIIKGDYCIIKVIMYEKEYRNIVDDLLKNEGGLLQESRSGVHNVENGSIIKIVLDSPDVIIEDNIEIQTWIGEYLDFSFAFSLPDNYPKRQILFFAIVYINDMIACKLKFFAYSESNGRNEITVMRKDVFSAFISYASQDRNRVATIIQGMKKIRPELDIFFDVETLRSGEKWEQSIYNEIEKRDVLFLCWSHFARESKWVEKEWRYALEKKGEDCIEPIPFEPPDICPPPEELGHKHFNDKLLYLHNLN